MLSNKTEAEINRNFGKYGGQEVAHQPSSLVYTSCPGRAEPNTIKFGDKSNMNWIGFCRTW